MRERIQNRYEVLHKQLDEGKLAAEIIQSELAYVFPELDEDRLHQISSGLKETCMAYKAEMDAPLNKPDVTVVWQERLLAMDEDEQLDYIHACRLLDKLMTEENIRLASEGKMELNEDNIKEMLAEMESDTPAYEQLENFLNWIGNHDFLGMEKWFWEKQKLMLDNLAADQIPEAVLRQFYGTVNTIEERMLYSCAQMIETANPSLNPELYAPAAALIANAELDCGEVYCELAAEQIDAEEAMSRLEKIWNCVEAVLVEILPAIAMVAILFGCAWVLFNIQGTVGFLMVPACMLIALTAGMAYAIVEDKTEYLLGKIGDKIKKCSKLKVEKKETDGIGQWIPSSVFTEEELALAELID